MRIDPSRLRAIEARAERARAGYIATSDRFQELTLERHALNSSMRAKADAEGIDYGTGRRRFRAPLPTLPPGMETLDADARASLGRQLAAAEDVDLLAVPRARLKAMDEEIAALGQERERVGQVQNVTAQLAAACRTHAQTATQGGTTLRRLFGA